MIYSKLDNMLLIGTLHLLIELRFGSCLGEVLVSADTCSERGRATAYHAVSLTSLRFELVAFPEEFFVSRMTLSPWASETMR